MNFIDLTLPEHNHSYEKKKNKEGNLFFSLCCSPSSDTITFCTTVPMIEESGSADDSQRSLQSAQQRWTSSSGRSWCSERSSSWSEWTTAQEKKKRHMTTGRAEHSRRHQPAKSAPNSSISIIIIILFPVTCRTNKMISVQIPHRTESKRIQRGLTGEDLTLLCTALGTVY